MKAHTFNVDSPLVSPTRLSFPGNYSSICHSEARSNEETLIYQQLRRFGFASLRLSVTR